MKRLDEVGLDAADHKCTRSETSIKWCGKNYSQGEIKHDPEGLAGLATMRGPETAGKLMQFLQAVICLLYTSPSPRDATLSRMPSSA